MSTSWRLAALVLIACATFDVARAGHQPTPIPVISSASAGTVGAAVAPRLIRVSLGGRSIAELLEAGFDLVDVKAGGEVQMLEWPGDEAKLARLGLAAEVVDEHPGRTAAMRAAAELTARAAPAPKRVRSATGADGVFRVQTLPPFGSGSMGGYWTSDEIKMKLDDLVAGDLNDVVADKIDTLGTSGEGRPIWGLKLGKRVDGPDPRPVVFLNALTHAREPEGMQALFYFVDDLLSRYGIDAFATSLLDQRVIYIVPLVNPDGYKVNENTYQGSGSFGYWRKNTRDNNGNQIFDMSIDGVDINRNYGYQWGFNNTGSSPTPSDETYRGPSAFSEPETRVQRDIVTALRPVTGLSFHTYGDLMIHPWGWTTTPAPDLAAFQEWSDELTRDNAYLSGAAPAVLYQVNGEFNDWCYGDTLTKPKAFTWTPEVGSGGDSFWPAPSRIVPLAAENLRACYVATAIAGPYVQEDGTTLVEGALNAGHGSNLLVRARNLGATGSAGPELTGTLTALGPGVNVIVGTVSYPTLGPRQSGDPAGPFAVAVDDTVTPGRLLRFEVAFCAPNGFFSRDTISIPAGTPTLVASDGASSGLGQWSPFDSWGIVANDPGHPSRYFADSPAGAYSANADNHLQFAATLNLSPAVHAYALYESKWEFEPDYDAATIEASFNGSTWTRIGATGTTRGSGLSTGQPSGQPIYAGSRRLWRPELADLSAFTGPAGSAVRFRFRVQSDDANPYGLMFDGFGFDSLRIVLYDPAAQPTPTAVGDDAAPPASMALSPPWPNPVRGFARFAFTLPSGGPARLEVLDVQGRRVRTLVDGMLAANRYLQGWDLRDEVGRAVAPGMYLASLSGPAGHAVRRFVVLD